MVLRSMVQSSGVRDWVIQRVSAVVLGVYSIGLLAIFLTYPQLDYDAWKAICGGLPMKVSSSVAILCLGAHAWIGMWTVTTDYLTPIQLGRFAATVRFTAQIAIVALILGYLVWGFYIFWGLA